MRVRERLALVQFGGGIFGKAMVNLAGVDRVIALAATKVDSVPSIVVERGTGDRQCLALSAGFLNPIVDPAGSLALSRTFETTTSRSTLQACLYISRSA